MLPAKKTRRKFYNKYLYKTTLNIPGISITRRVKGDYADLKNYLDSLSSEVQLSSYSWVTNNSKAIVNKDTILDFVFHISNKKDILTRIERDYIDIYTNDKNDYDSISSTFEYCLKQRFEPEDADLEHISDENILICSKLPKNRYNYRVYLKPHKLAKDRDQKTRFLNYLEGLGSAVSITQTVKQWFMTTDWNWDRRYMLVEDEKTLLMLKLRNSEVLGKVIRFVVPINTECPQKV